MFFKNFANDNFILLFKILLAPSIVFTKFSTKLNVTIQRAYFSAKAEKG
jgi:hypothetical protein